MTRAEEQALKAYPVLSLTNDTNAPKRKYFTDGYALAEQDLELTWKDMELIYEISCDAFNEQDGCFYNVSEIWKEVHKRFKERKKNKL